jgi:glycosyltransferase involved in cell wall biosynthesis
MQGQSRLVTYFVGSFLPPSEVFMVEQARHLAKYRARFIATGRQSSQAAERNSAPVDYTCDSLHGRLATAQLKIMRKTPLLLRDLLQGCAILHAHFGRNGYVAWPIARELDIPFVTTFHGFDATFVGDPRTVEGINQRRYFRRGRRQMAEAGVNCIAVSNYIRVRLLELGFCEQKIFRNYIGIDTALFSPQVGTERVKGRVVCVSRFVEYKGHRFVIDALAELNRSGLPTELVLVGEGPLRNEIEKDARKKLAQVVVLTNQSPAQIVSLLRTAQLYLHGSYRTSTGHAEALGLSVLEAQAVGTPVVAFDSGGVGEGVSRGRSGYLVPEKDVKAMSAKIAALLTDSSLWEDFSRAAVNFVRSNFDIEQCSRSLEDTYDNIISAHFRDGREKQHARVPAGTMESTQWKRRWGLSDSQRTY